MNENFEETELSIGNWKIIRNKVGGINFLGPRGIKIYLAPFAPESEKKQIIKWLRLAVLLISKN